MRAPRAQSLPVPFGTTASVQRAPLLGGFVGRVLEEQRVVEAQARRQHQRDQVEQAQRDAGAMQQRHDQQRAQRHRQQHAAGAWP